LKRYPLTLLVAILASGSITFARYSQTASERAAVMAAVAPATYPAIARTAGARGDVVVEVLVDSKGNVVSTKIISGHALLQKVSEDAAKQWKFSPSPESTKTRAVQLTFGFQTVDAGRNPKYEFTIVFLPPYKVDVREHARIIE